MDRPNTPMAGVARSVARGGGLGLFLAGVVLLGWVAVLGHPVDCTDLDPQECGIAREAVRAENRREMWMGAALVLLGLGVVVGLQAYLRADGSMRRRS